MRVFPDGNGTSSTIENNLDRALDYFPLLPVNAVYSPENVNHLPEAVDYLVSLGVRNVYLNPIIKKLGEEGILLAHHGTPLMNIISEMCSSLPDH